LAAAIATGRTAEALLFGLEPRDPVTLAIGVAVLATIAIVASYVPAERAAHRSPLMSLKED
jgi:hypothetical protein